ncbi:MAG TPA: MFS transporter [Alphaproteobacteria bacterium]|nr:MFS transporter [Alphaproteobacteria bacterium]
MRLLAFVRDNARWLAGGFLLTFFSSFGQTYFISLSAGDIRREYALSHGEFGTLYMAATLASALTLMRLGQAVDRYAAQRVAVVVVPMLALAAASMALSRHVVLLFVTLYLLRLFGQGMMTHTAFTAVGRWFSAQRGRAVSIVTLGMNAGEALFPLVFVALAASVGWRDAWLAAAGALMLVALPAIASLIAVERLPRASDPVAVAPEPRDWTRAEVLRDPVFYLVILGVMPLAFIGNAIFFHQVHLVELRGWSLEIFASSFVLMASTTFVFALVSGHLVDRFSARALLPFYLLPLGLGCFLLGRVEAEWAAFAFMALFGLSNGFSLTLYGSLWPETYGVRHLGSIRALLTAIMVFVSAMGPGIIGILIDRGVGLPAQIVAMGVYCVAISVVMRHVSRRVKARAVPA